jgi:hypothetical protein
MVNRISLAAMLSLLLQAQAHGASLSEISNTLVVYPDNRIGYVLTGAGSSDTTRVWSSGNQVLALRVKDRLINSIDIDTVSVKYTGQGRTPLAISVTLRTGDELAANFTSWGSDVEWAACSSLKVCEYLERNSSALRFPSFPTFLNSVTDSAIEDKVKKQMSFGAQMKSVTIVPSNNLSNSLPVSLGSYKLVFKSVEEISDIQTAIQIEWTRRAALEQCIADGMRAGERRLKEEEAQFVRLAPPGREAAWREQWQQSNSSTFWLTQIQMGCQQKHRRPR